MNEKVTVTSQNNGHTFLGLFGGAVVAAVTATVLEIINRNIGEIRDDPFRFSVLTPIVSGLFCLLVLLPIVRVIYVRLKSRNMLVLLPTFAFACMASTMAMLSPGQASSVFVLGISVFITFSVPFGLSTLAATRIWKLQ